MTTDGTAGRRATLAVIAWMLAATGLTACSGGPYGSGDGPDAPTGPSATFRTMPEWDAESGGAHTPIEPGTYLVPRSPWSVADFTVTFPAGWTVQYGHVYGSNAEAADEFGFYAVVVDEVFHDSCAPEDETTRAVGPGIDDLGTALREQLGGAAVSEPVSTTLGGYPATRIDLEVPEQVDVARCRLAPVGLQIWYSEPADKYFVLLAGATASVYVVAVDGRRQVFLTQVSGSTSAADRAELQAVLDSIRIEGSSSTSDQSPTSTASAADGSLYFAADTRGGDDLMDPVSFEQGEFHPKPPDIYLSRRGAPVRRVVASHGSDRCPRVAPDGDHLAYLQDSTLVIARLDAAGEPGGPRVRTHLPEPPSLCPQWSPDGRSVGYVVFVGDAPLYTARPAEMRAVSLAGEDRVVASFGAQTWHQPAFAWSPDGKEVAYTTETGVWRARPGGRAELLWRPAAGDPSQELPMAYDRPTSLAWSRRGEIAFTVYASEPDAPDNPYGRGTETWAVRVIDPEIRRVERLGAISYGGAPAWSPDGGQLAFRGPDGRIRVHDRASGSTTRVPRAGGRVGHGDLAWSPDGDRLLTFTRADAKGYALVSVLLDGSTTERRSPWTWALDWIAVDDVDWSSR